MKAIFQLVVVVLLLGSYMTPAMACMVSDVSMSAEEHACCRTMQHQCSQMEMPASHRCCQKSPRSAQGDAIATEAATFHPVMVAVLWLHAVELVDLNSVTTRLVEYAIVSPPQSPPSSVSVLRV